MTMVFSDAAVEKFDENYQDKVRPVHGNSSRGGCMKAVYIGLGTLFGDDFGFRGSFHRKFFRASRRKEKARKLPEGRLNTIDRVFRALEKEGVAFSETKYKPRAGKWRLADGSIVESLEEELVCSIESLPNGSHFFGVAASSAIHSLILRLHKTSTGVTVYWMDQFSDGFDKVRPGGFVSNPDVTGLLDQELLAFGNNPSSIWEFDPDAAQDVIIETDIDADGAIDFRDPAVVDMVDHLDRFIDL